MSSRIARAEAFLWRELASGPRPAEELSAGFIAEEGVNNGSVQQALYIAKRGLGVRHRIDPGGPFGTGYAVWYIARSEMTPVGVAPTDRGEEERFSE